MIPEALADDLLGQRLLLRLPVTDPVVMAYERVRAALVEVGEAYGNGDVYVRGYDERAAKLTVPPATCTSAAVTPPNGATENGADSRWYGWFARP